MAVHRIVPRNAPPTDPEVALDAAVAAAMAEDGNAPGRMLSDIVRPQTPTDAMVAAIGDQLCAIIKETYDFTITIDADTDNIHIQKLTLLLNSLLESARRNIRSLSELADGLEEKVRERTQRLDLVVQGANDGVWIWEPGKGTAEFSARWRQMLGLEQAAPGRIEDWLDRVHPDDIERLRAALRSHLQGTTQFLHEDYRILHADGTWRWMWCRGKCSRDATGRATMMAGTQTDVHALRSIDAATGLPNESTALSQIENLLRADRPFRAMVIGVPRVVSMKEDLGTAEIELLRAAIARRLSATLPFDADFFTDLGGHSLLAARFVNEAAQAMGLGTRRLATAAIERLQQHAFPGNVRELRNLCFRLVALAASERIPAAAVDAALRDAGVAHAGSGEPDSAWRQALEAAVQARLAQGTQGFAEALREAFDETLLATALAHHRGHRQRAAEQLGIGRNTVARKLGPGRRGRKPG